MAILRGPAPHSNGYINRSYTVQALHFRKCFWCTLWALCSCFLATHSLRLVLFRFLIACSGECLDLVHCVASFGLLVKKGLDPISTGAEALQHSIFSRLGGYGGLCWCSGKGAHCCSLSHTGPTSEHLQNMGWGWGGVELGVSDSSLRCGHVGTVLPTEVHLCWWAGIKMT